MNDDVEVVGGIDDAGDTAKNENEKAIMLRIKNEFQQQEALMMQELNYSLDELNGEL